MSRPMSHQDALTLVARIQAEAGWLAAAERTVDGTWLVRVRHVHLPDTHITLFAPDAWEAARTWLTVTLAVTGVPALLHAPVSVS